MTAEEIIHRLGLQPLPGEGGYFKKTYEGKGTVPAHGSERRLVTAIYYLVTPDAFSALHRVKSDEIFHFYAGDPVEMCRITPEGELMVTVLGNDLGRNHTPQVVVPAGQWQGTRLVEDGSWALMGCTVSPGFEFDDFELGGREALCRLFPQHREIIRAFTR